MSSLRFERYFREFELKIGMAVPGDKDGGV
jgi:hypothetical protein